MQEGFSARRSLQVEVIYGFYTKKLVNFEVVGTNLVTINVESPKHGGL